MRAMGSGCLAALASGRPALLHVALMPGIARTTATGGEGMLDELLAWSSSFDHDRALVREDLVGSAAHVTMLARTGDRPPRGRRRPCASALRTLYDEAVRRDAAPARRRGGRAHGRRGGARQARRRRRRSACTRRARATTRSPSTCASTCATAAPRSCGAVSGLVAALAERAAARDGRAAPRVHAPPARAARERRVPAGAWGVGLARGRGRVVFALDHLEMPLGSGACSGTSLPIDRALVARLFAPWQPTRNALHTVGDRDFALDWTWARRRAWCSPSAASPPTSSTSRRASSRW